MMVVRVSVARDSVGFGYERVALQRLTWIKAEDGPLRQEWVCWGGIVVRRLGIC